jgi:hypothetical protein
MRPEQVVSDDMRDKRRTGIIWLVVALILAMTLGFAYRSDRRADTSDLKLSQSGAQVEVLTGQVKENGQIAQSAKSAAEEANRRLAAAGKPTVPVPTESPISPTVPAPIQQDELNAAEAAAVREIVADQVARSNTPVTQAEITQIARAAVALIPKPADGKTPTPAELQTYAKVALASYCLEGRCDPKPGEKGDKGDKGDPAPKVTDEELLRASQTALAAHCAQQSGGTCEGTAGINGTNGTDGKDGADGRGVTDIDCMDDGRWRITYDKPFPDGEAVRYSRGPCRLVVAPDPTPAAKTSR